MTQQNTRSVVLQKIREDIEKVQTKAARLRRTNTTMILTSTLASGLSAILAGVTAARGPMVAAGPTGWKLTCGAIAVLSACAGLFSGLHQQLSVTDRLAKVLDCGGKLKALEISLTINYRDPVEVSKDYQVILQEHQQALL
jgi:hypothetical protein